MGSLQTFPVWERFSADDAPGEARPQTPGEPTLG